MVRLYPKRKLVNLMASNSPKAWRQVHTWHEVQFVQPTLKLFDLFFGQVVDHVDFSTADVHVGCFHTQADVA